MMDENRIAAAELSLKRLLKVDDLNEKRFLDIGAGSGLFSLAAKRLGASVSSFDADEGCIECVRRLADTYQTEGDWLIEKASVLDDAFMARLDRHDIVYSWGVLHHTGNMWRALENAAASVTEQGMLAIAIYNDQGWRSRYWTKVKSLYNGSSLMKWILICLYAPYFVGLRYVVRQLTGKGKLERGMSLWYDMLDWLGGYPFEVGTPGQIVEFFVERDFSLIGISTCGGRSGCNEFVFKKSPPAAVP